MEKLNGIIGEYESKIIEKDKEYEELYQTFT